jgi:hypothetical protein
MGQLFEELEALMWDERLIESSVAQGLLDEQTVKKYYEALPDLSSKCESFELIDEDMIN